MKVVTIIKNSNNEVRITYSGVTDEEAAAMLREGIERIEHR